MLALIWVTNMITNKILDRILARITDKILDRIIDKILDRITDKITDMTSKLQMLITFVTVVRLRPTIYQNAQNSKENLDKGIWYTIFSQKKSLTSSISCSKIKHPTFFSFLFFFFLVFFSLFFSLLFSS